MLDQASEELGSLDLHHLLTHHPWWAFGALGLIVIIAFSLF